MRLDGPPRPGRPGFALLACCWLGLAAAAGRADDLDASNWSAKVDPPAQAVPAPTNKSFAIPFPGNFGGGGEATYPAVPSPFVAIGKNFFDNDVRQVWDLSARKQVGAVKGPLQWDDKTVALSGDGALIVGKTNRKLVEVRNTKTGRIAQTFDLDTPFVDFIEFAGPGRVVYGKLGDRRLLVGDVKSGDKVSELRLGANVPAEGVAISPGGSYLVAASNTEGRLEVFDAATGQVVGEAPAPRKNGTAIHCAGLAFADDGSELAGLFESFGAFTLVVWDAASGRMMDEFDLGKTVQKPTFYKDRGVAYFPDKAALLVLGCAVVDRQSGRKVWNLPFDDKNLKVSPRHFLDADHAVVVSFAPGMALRTAEVPRDKIAAASAIVREGGNAADAALPPLTSTDLASARRVDLEAKAGAWAVAAAAPAGPKRLTTRAVRLKNKADEARALLFAGRDSTVAAVYGTASRPNADDPSDGQPRWLERFDLASGRALGAIELPAASNPIALGPDGAAILVREAKAKDRLDLFNAADAKPIVGWRPYGAESGEGREVRWADFLDAKRVATVGGGGALAVWSLPDLKVEYVVEDAFHGSPTLSPDRRWLAGFDGRTLRVLDAATGALVGEAAAPGNVGPRPDWKGGAFRPDGLAFAGQFGPQTLVRWDLATGKVAAEVRPPSSLPAGPVEWLGDRHALLDNRTLVDFGTKRVVWEYLGAPIGAPGPDGRHWFVARGEPGQEAGRLLNIDAADPALDRAEARLADAKSPAVLRPGTRVSVQVDAAGPSVDPAGYRKALADALAARLKANGMTVVEDGPPTGRPAGGAVRVSFARAPGPEVRLVLTVREQATGENLQFQGFGMGRGQVETVPLVNLTCEMTLVDGAGPVACGTAYTAYMRPFGFILHMPPGETMAGPYLRKLQWERIKQWTASAVPPYFVARDGAGVIRLPGYTDMNQLK